MATAPGSLVEPLACDSGGFASGGFGGGWSVTGGERWRK
jgi:hypothetical protein